MELDTIQARVRRGVELLDKQAPPDWRNRIDLGTLKIEYEEDCVLGQVYGNFEEGLEFVGIKSCESIEYGFNICARLMGSAETVDEVCDEFDVLNAEWRSVLSGNEN